MQLNSKKQLAAKVFGVGTDRILFVESRLAEIKEAITRQDIRDLHNAGAIKIKDASGRRKIVKRKHRRRTGRFRKKINQSKADYVIITRKLRKFAKHLLKTKKIDKEAYGDVRRKIRARIFKSRRHLNETLETK